MGVVNDDFTTDAELVGSTVTAKKDSSLSDSGSVKVAADSSTGVTTVVAGMAGSMGAAASTISVNNVNSQTSAVVDNSKVTAEQDFAVDAHNKVTTKFNAATLGAGGAAIATGVGVNTIGTSTLAKVNKSTITAQKAAITSREELDVDQNLVGATVGGMGLNANVMVTSIGTKLADTYGNSDNDKEASFDTAAVLKKANTALDSQKTATTDDTTASSKVVKDTLHNADTGVASTDASGVTASSGKNDAKGTQVAVTDSAITTADTLNLSADRKTDAKITAASASVSGSLGLSATVAVLDAKKDAGVSISGSTLKANNALSVTADQSGETSIDAYQANIAGVAALSAAYAQSSSSGETKVEAVDSTLISDNRDITMKAADTSQTTSSVYGATAGLVTAGALISKADNASDTDLAIKGSNLETAQEQLTCRPIRPMWCLPERTVVLSAWPVPTASSPWQVTRVYPRFSSGRAAARKTVLLVARRQACRPRPVRPLRRKRATSLLPFSAVPARLQRQPLPKARPASRQLTARLSMLTGQKSQPVPKARMEKTTVKPRSRALQRPAVVRPLSIRQQPIRTSIQR